METKPHVCRYCIREIDPRASVCYHCSSPQSHWRNWLQAANVISIAFLLLSIWQFIEAALPIQRPRKLLHKLGKPSVNAQTALSRAAELESRVLEARREVVDLSESVAAIADYIPRAGAFGGLGPAAEDLKKEIKKLQERIKKHKTRYRSCRPDRPQL